MRSLHFLYHELRPAASRYLYVTPTAEFAQHCLLFARLRAERTEGHLLPEITFDDGHVSDVEFALPALEQHGLRARFFITVAWTGRRAGFMDGAQLRSLRAAGHEVGAHGLTHKLLTSCSEQELQQELRESKERLQDYLGSAVTTMSLPGGRADRRVFRACADAGFRQVFTSVPKAESLEEQPRTVGRLNLRAGTTAAWLEDVLQPQTGALARLQRTHRFKSAAQNLLGDHLYARLWAVLNREEGQSAPDAKAAAP